MEDKNKAKFVEEAGLLMESFGMTRMSGRILGAILVSDNEKISFFELVEWIRASKSSISTNIRLLIRIGFVKMVTIPADRKTYYILNDEINWGDLLSNRMKMLTLFKILLRKAWDLRVDKNDRTSNWTRNAIGFYEWTEKAMTEMIDKYNNTGIRKEK